MGTSRMEMLFKLVFLLFTIMLGCNSGKVIKCVCRKGKGSDNIRAGRSTSTAIVGSLNPNECMLSTDPCPGGWCKVIYRWKTAYVHTSVVSMPQICGHPSTGNCINRHCGGSFMPVGRKCDSGGYGCGYYGATRVRNNSPGIHNGNDVVCSANQAIYAPFHGYVNRDLKVYKWQQEPHACCDKGFEYTSTDPDWPGFKMKVFYAKDTKVNVPQKKGAQIGTHIGLHCGCYTNQMTDHSHVELWKDGVRINPTSFLYCKYV